MTRYLLDTNIISNAVKTAPSRALLESMEEHEKQFPGARAINPLRGA